ncbi:MAG: hypothetical protein LBS98_00360 [Coriobacteriales bacterium]|jgi:cell division protein FtsL|nr:hypothetical protein [Coriobacteriales bacterium]
MAQAAYAYQEPARRYRETERPLPQRPPLRVLPGKKAAPKKRTTTQLLSASQIKTLFTVVVCAGLFIALVCGVRVALSTMTYETLLSSEAISSDIAAARNEGNLLEVQYSVATSPSRIQQKASEELGMAPASQVELLNPISEE